ncbi:alpha/beta hydrolase [Halobacteriales archaeon QS_4_62_28]|nr:MAG: alpha/beta hydrolase [Halobacteriales archaeon QS_4_62_28]
MTTDPDSQTVHRDIDFHETPERTLSLDVYEPIADGPSPTIVLFYGGKFWEGDKERMAQPATALAAEGYVVVTPNYRLSDEATFPAALIDAKAAVEWCRAEGERYGIDPRQIATVGHSAGGNLATLVSVTAAEPGFEPEAYPGVSSTVQAAVGWAGVYDLAFPDGPDPECHVQYLGGTREDVPEAYEFASPMGQTDLQTPPTLVVHGDDDDALPVDQAKRYAESVDTFTTGEFRLFEDAGHTFPIASLDRTVEVTVEFLNRHLGESPGNDPTDR